MLSYGSSSRILDSGGAWSASYAFFAPKRAYHGGSLFERCDRRTYKQSFCSFPCVGWNDGDTRCCTVGNGFCVELIGGTDDLTAGQAIDRIGVAMGLDFPCGKQMEDLCFTEVHASIPKPRICVKSLHCNMSGLENLALKLYANTDNIGLVCDYTFSFVANTLDKLSENLRIEYPDIPIVYSGGVMSNSKIKDVLSKRNNTYFARPEFSSDNAAGVALLCRREFLNDK
ncbi:MAG: hypothetical protein UH851_05430 [Clostridia bacterium]|nr:hypothetical protein [Clostridia bacterium]